MGQGQNDQHAHKAHGNRQHDQHRIYEGPELSYQDEIEEKERQHKAEAEALERRLHAFHHAVQVHADVFGFLDLRQDVLNAVRDVPQVLSGGSHIDVRHALDLVVIDFRGSLNAGQLDDGIQGGRKSRVGRVQRNIAQIQHIVYGRQPMFVVLDGKVVIVPAFVVDPVIGRDHVIGVQRGDHIIHDVFLRKTQFARVYPVDIQPDAGIVHILRDVDFAHVAQRPDAGSQVLRKSEVPLQVRAADLHVDRRGHARVDDRVHHRTALEERTHVRQLRGDGLSDAGDVLEAACLMIVVQRYLNGAGILARVVCIQGREIVHHSDVREHHLEIVGAYDLVNQVFHFLYILFGHFNPRAGGGLHVDGELARVGSGKERHAAERIDPQTEEKHARQRQHGPARPYQRAAYPAFV